MDRIKFEQILIATGFEKKIRPQNHRARGSTKPPYWYEYKEKRETKCGEAQSMTCGRSRIIRLLPEGRQISCHACKCTWIQHLKD